MPTSIRWRNDGLTYWRIDVKTESDEELQRRAAATRQNPSLLVQEALARWLAGERSAHEGVTGGMVR
jgi:predicted transcriptional regulator